MSARWRGLIALIRDAVEHGSLAVERLQKETAARPFAALELIAPIAGPVRVVRALHDFSVSTTHLSIRLAARTVGGAVDAVLAAEVEVEVEAEPPEQARGGG